MSKPDGSIIIDTKIDNKGVIEGIREMSSKSMKLANDIKKTEAEIRNLETEMKNMSKIRLNQKELDKVQGKIKETKAELDKLINDAMKHEDSLRIDGMSDADMQRVYEMDKRWQQLSQDIESAESKLDGYRERLKQLKADDSTMADTAAYHKKADKLEYSKAKLEELKKKQEKMPSSAERVGKAIRKIGEAGKKGFGSCVRSLNKVRKAGGSAFRAIIKHSGRGKKSTDKMNGSFLQTLSLLRRMAGTMLFFQAFAKVTESISNTISKLILKDMSLAKSLAQVKANLATAFTPIWNVALPYIKVLVNWLSVATAKLGGFLSALTGMKAISMEGTVGETADDLDKVAKSAKKATHQLNSYDKLNVRKKETDSNKNKGSDKKGVRAQGVTAGNWDSLVKKLKDSWKKEDFSWLGKMLADKINKSMANIPWKKIKRSAKKIAKCIGTFFNGFIGKLNWKLLGKTMAEGLNTAILFLNTLLTTLKWGKLGRGIANAMNGFLKKTDWKGAGRVIRNCLNAVFQLASTWSAGFNFKLLGKSLAKAVNSAIAGIKWKDALKAATNIGKGIADTANGFIRDTDFKKLGKTVADAIKVGINGWYSYVTTFNFNQLGKKIGDSINGFFKKMNKVDDKSGLTGWEKLGKSITKSIGGIVDAIITALDTVDWDSVGYSIGTFLAAQDWLDILGKVAKAIWKALGGALKAWKSWFNAEPVSAGIVSGILAAITVAKFLKIANKIARIFKGDEYEGIVKSGVKSLAKKIGKAFGKETKAEMASDTVAEQMSGGISESATKTGKSSKLKSAFSKLGKALGVIMAVEIVTEIIGKIGSDFLEKNMGDIFKDDGSTSIASSAAITADWMNRVSKGEFISLADVEDEWAAKDKKAKDKAKKEMRDKEDKARAKELGLSKAKYAKYKEALAKFQREAVEMGMDPEKAKKIIAKYTKEIKKGTLDVSSLTKKFNKEITKNTKNKSVDSQANLLKYHLSQLNVEEKTQEKIVKSLNKALKNGTISYTDYQKLAKTTYYTTKDFNNALNKIAGKKVAAKIMAEVTGKKDVDNLDSCIKNLDNKSVKITAKADTTPFERKIKDATTGRYIKVSMKVNTKDFSAKVRNALQESKYKMSAAQIFPDKKQIQEYFKKVMTSQKVKVGIKFQPVGMGIVVNDKKKTVTINKSLDLGGMMAKSYKAAGYQVQYSKYAKGGNPSSGEVYVANENGNSELIGRIGRRATVMNNDQIVQSVSDGVYSAVVAAMKHLRGLQFAVNMDLSSQIEPSIAKYATALSNMPIKTYTIPAIAKGCVMPQNKEFLKAVYGTGGEKEQSFNEMVKAMCTAMRKEGLAGGETIILHPNESQLYQVIVKKDEEHKDLYGRTGMSI